MSSQSSKKILGIFSVSLLGFFPILSHADCTSPAGVAGEFIFDSGRFKGCDGTNWKNLDETNPCSSGFSRVTRGKESFCISTNEETTDTFRNARDTCGNKNTNSQGFAWVCHSNEWYMACDKGADPGEPTITNMTGNREWVGDFGGNGDASYDYIPTHGSTSCTSIVHRRFQGTGTNRFRCCYR